MSDVNIQIYFNKQKNEPIILIIGSNQTKTIMKKPKLTLNQLKNLNKFTLFLQTIKLFLLNLSN